MFKFNHSGFYGAISYLLDKNIVRNKGDIAQDFEISPSKFSEILNKRMNPNIELYVILINKYGFNPEWLLTGSGEMLKTEQKAEPKSEITGMVLEPSVAIETKKNGCSYCATKDIRIADLEKTIRLLEKLIASLEREIDHYKKP